MTSLFGHSVRSDLVLLYVVEALAVFMALYVLLAWQAGVPREQSQALAMVGAMICGLISGATGLYRAETLSRARRLATATIVAGVLFTISLPALALFDSGVSAGIHNHLLAITIGFAGAIITTRLGYAAIARSGLLKRRLVLLRAPGAASFDLDRLNADPRHGRFEVVASFGTGEALEAVLEPGRLAALRPWAVVLDHRVSIPADLSLRLKAAGIRLMPEGELFERELNRLDIERLPAGWLAQSRAAREGAIEAALRRGFDILLSASLLLVTLPLLLATAAAIKLDSPGPVFYRQDRVGRGNRVFMLFKFRSMREDAEAGGRAIWASKGDPRVTRVGRFIRLTRIDEIPQVFNVLRGDMAFVGPRPERPCFVEQLGRQIPHYHDRAAVKPGITGWAQVNYPYGASVEDARMKLAYDLYYVARRSLFLDLLILVATVRVILFQEGAR
jgi:exopolysaccharide biosynthesis polyprenyl glycosylphosphotransferase